MPRSGARDLVKEQFWRDVIQKWRSSHESSPAFCQRLGYKYHQFQDWKKVIAKRDTEVAIARRKSSSTASDNQFDGRITNKKQPQSSATNFVPARIKEVRGVEAESIRDSKIEIILTCGLVVRSTSTCCAKTLSSLIFALENR